MSNTPLFNRQPGNHHPASNSLLNIVLLILGLLSGSLGLLLSGFITRQQIVYGSPTTWPTASPWSPPATLWLALTPTIAATAFLGLFPFIARKRSGRSRQRLNLCQRFAWSILIGTFLAAAVPLLAFLLNFDTEFAPGYSARSFAAVAVGDSEADVRARLGQPLEVIELSAPGAAWQGAQRIYVYSRSPASKHYRLRQIGFDHRGLVSLIQHEIYWD